MSPLSARAACPLLLLAVAAGGCGLLPSGNESLSGRYEADEFRIETTAGEAIDVGEAGGTLRMTLRSEGRVRGRLIGGEVEGEGRRLNIAFSGTYVRDGDRVQFDFGEALSADYFGTGMPLGDVPWVFNESEGVLRADARAYVIFLQKESEVEAG